MLVKSIPYVIGCIFGVAGLFLFNTFGESNSRVATASLERPVAVSELAVPAVRSPLAVVAEAPVSELEGVDESQASPDSERLQEMEDRLADAEARIESLELVLANVSSPITQNQPEEAPNLLTEGFDPNVVSEIETVRNDLQLQRLELRDRATREGWVNSDDFRQAYRDLNEGNTLRQTLGDDEYDRLLLAEGRSNRIQIDSIIANSAADIAGIQDGDVIYSYANDRIYTFRDLRAATTAGIKDEPVAIQLVRDDTLIDLVIPRGPLGVTISPTTDDG